MFDSDGDNNGHPELPYDGVVGLGKFLDYAAITHISPYLLSSSLIDTVALSFPASVRYQSQICRSYWSPSFLR